MVFKRIYIEISNICNLRCSFCSPVTRKARTMSVDEFGAIADKIKLYTKYVYLHVKGEPLLHRELSEILDICQKNGFLVNITTNGTLLSSMGDVLLKFSCINQVNISVHSFKEQGEEYQKQYINDIILFGKKAEVEGKPYVVYRMWNGNDGETLDNESYEILNTICSEFKENYHLSSHPNKGRSGTLSSNVFLNWEDKFEWPTLNNSYVSSEGTCRGARDMLAILCDGTVVPCCLDSDGAIDLGNIFTHSMEEIVNSKRYQNILNGFRNGKITEELCQKCSYRLRFTFKGKTSPNKNN